MRSILLISIILLTGCSSSFVEDYENNPQGIPIPFTSYKWDPYIHHTFKLDFWEPKGPTYLDSDDPDKAPPPVLLDTIENYKVSDPDRVMENVPPKKKSKPPKRDLSGFKSFAKPIIGKIAVGVLRSDVINPINENLKE